MAAGTKRANDDSTAPKAKKTKTEHKSQKRQSLADKGEQPTSSLTAEEVDFPRGGGTSFTPLEVKAIRAEAVKEVNEELFRVSVCSSCLIHILIHISFTLSLGQCK